MSARRISLAADAPVSSIYHHFGSLEQLFAASQEFALERALSWRDDRLAQLAGLSPSVDALPGLFAEMADEWTNAQRSLAFAWRECQLLTDSSPLLQPLAARWHGLWDGFWQEAGQRLGLGEGTQIVRRVFENESFLHMIRWRRLVDRASLDEMARTLGAWLTRGPAPATPWRDFARGEALRAMPRLPQRDETAARIVIAAREIIGDCGVASLTHRAVAERAGLTLGTVSHKFPTKVALLEAGFEGLYAANLERLQGSSDNPPNDHSPEAVRDTMIGMVDMIGRVRIRGSDELYVAVARDPSLSQFGLQLRYLRGRSSAGTLRALAGGKRAVTQAEAALFSSFATSQIRQFSGAKSADAATVIGGEIDILIAMLTP
ncbi:TetR family transcriptional regulator [Novosphingobium sp. FGD1]|uniref:TetR family transcriptional regulator n=2 Tax=Novosphingobium silvae TaxID=2692619 RepID=A0A7X4K7S7_9SPHN|nr:TetR family transcriptional regulator [Novosphingobium silvae]